MIIRREDAEQFACNAVVVKAKDQTPVILMNAASTELQQMLDQRGYRVIIQPVSEFIKAGGANKCLALSI